MKIKVVRVSHLENDKNGNPLMAKNGRPYTRCIIDLEDGRKASGFGNTTTRSWKDGDEVDVVLEQKGEYWNFSVPKVDAADIIDRVKKLEDAVFGAAAKPSSEPAINLTDDF